MPLMLNFLIFIFKVNNKKEISTDIKKFQDKIAQYREQSNIK